MICVFNQNSAKSPFPLRVLVQWRKINYAKWGVTLPWSSPLSFPHTFILKVLLFPSLRIPKQNLGFFYQDFNIMKSIKWLCLLGVWGKKWCHNEENESEAITLGTHYNTSCSWLGIVCWFGWHCLTSDTGSEFAYNVDHMLFLNCKPQMYFLQNSLCSLRWGTNIVSLWQGCSRLIC